MVDRPADGGVNTELKIGHLQEKRKTELQRAAGGADEVAEDGDVGAIDADAASVHGEAEQLGLFKIDPCVIEFG